MLEGLSKSSWNFLLTEFLHISNLPIEKLGYSSSIALYLLNCTTLSFYTLKVGEREVEKIQKLSECQEKNRFHWKKSWFYRFDIKKQSTAKSEEFLDFHQFPIHLVYLNARNRRIWTKIPSNLINFFLLWNLCWTVFKASPQKRISVLQIPNFFDYFYRKNKFHNFRFLNKTP